jgi:hypothetical protein
MKRNVVLRIFAIVVAIASIVAVAVIAYGFGTTNSVGGVGARFMPFRGHMVAGGHFPGIGLLGFAGLVVVGLLFVWWLATVLSPDRARPNGAVAAGPAPADVDRLKEQSDMHDHGQLTDDEFTAAKRKLLGLS